MRVLAIDSSGLTATVAVVENDKTIAEYTIDYKKTHSQTLLPMIDEMVKMIETDLSTVDAIAVAGGPGSFTGLRIGSATAKGLGLALGKPLVHIPTVDALAYQVFGWDGIICPIMDARRNQVYTGIYKFSEKAGKREGTNKMEPVFQVQKMQMAIPIEELIHRLNVYGKKVVFLGDGVPVYEAVLEANLQVPYCFAPAYMNRQRASAVGALAIQYYESGRFETAAEHQPDYLRVSQAERERAEKEAKAEIVVRELQQQDAAAVAEMEQQNFTDGWSEKSVLETIQQPHARCFAAEKAGRLIAYILTYVTGPEVEILRIAVEREARRQGVGGHLLLKLENICEEEKIKKILLDVRENNETAKMFYTDKGFVEDGIRQNFYENPKEDAVLMSRTLG